MPIPVHHSMLSQAARHALRRHTTANTKPTAAVASLASSLLNPTSSTTFPTSRRPMSTNTASSTANAGSSKLNQMPAMGQRQSAPATHQQPPAAATATGTVATPEPYLHLQDRPYLLQPIELAKPAARGNKIVYEVTLEVDEEIVPAYLEWIRRGHIQEVMALPGFLAWRMAAAEDVEPQTQGQDGQRRMVFVETYELADRAALQTYFDKYAQPVRDDHTRMWDGRFAARRRILHVFGAQSEAEAQLWKNREARNAFRLQNLAGQRAKVPRFTETGIKVAKLPAPLWEKLRAFYAGHKEQAVEDRLDPNEISINTWVAPTRRLDLPPALAEEVVQTMKPLLEAWTGIPELESTGISGIRTYLPGATIQNHVDMATTNVISALINIDQDVAVPWPLEMADHQGEVHPLDLQPGDFVMYESAVCAHARPKPLQGSHMTNLFMRFRPKGWTFTYDDA